MPKPRPTRADLLARTARRIGTAPRRLLPSQLVDLEICHLQTIDGITSADAGREHLIAYVGSVLTFGRMAELSGLGQEHMLPLHELAARLIERYTTTGRVRFTGPELQMAREGSALMAELARAVDYEHAAAAADWSEAELQRRLGAMAAGPRLEAATC